MSFQDLFAHVDSRVIELFPTTFQLEVSEGSFQDFIGIFKDSYEEFDVEKGMKVLIDVPNLRVKVSDFPVGKLVYMAKIKAKYKDYEIREIKVDSYGLARVLLSEV